LCLEACLLFFSVAEAEANKEALSRHPKLRTYFFILIKKFILTIGKSSAPEITISQIASRRNGNVILMLHICSIIKEK
jgi:hypothetical protein